MARRRHGTEEGDESPDAAHKQDYSDFAGGIRTPSKEQQEKEIQEQRDAAQQEYNEKTEEAAEAARQRGEEPPEPPPEAASHEGLGTYRLMQDANVKHQDHKRGDIVYLTSDDYQALRAVGVHCEAVEQQEQPQ